MNEYEEGDITAYRRGVDVNRGDRYDQILVKCMVAET